jgi:hypothetical protein
LSDDAMGLAGSSTGVPPAQFARQLGLVCKVLAELPVGAQWVFLTTPKGSLSGLTPMQALAQGRYADVRTAAQGYAER